MTFGELSLNQEFTLPQKEGEAKAQKYLKIAYGSARRHRDGQYVGINQDREVETYAHKPTQEQ